jgi:hypothetical protein
VVLCGEVGTTYFEQKGTRNSGRLVGRFRNVRACFGLLRGLSAGPGMGIGNVETCFRKTLWLIFHRVILTYEYANFSTLVQNAGHSVLMRRLRQDLYQ